MKLKPAEIVMNSFEEMSVRPEVLSALDKMGIKNPTEIQRTAIPAGLNSGDIIGVAQTGSGKTIAYALVVIDLLYKKPEARALILVPSREMAQQVHRVFMALTASSPIDCVLVIGGISNDKQVSHLKKHPKLVVATPGRMNDHLQSNKLLLQNTEIVVIDEADRMVDMGFAPQLESVRKTLRGTRQTLMFSASYNPNVEKIANSFFMQENAYFIKTAQAETPVAELQQRLVFLFKKDKNDRLLDVLNASKNGVIVFTADQERCEFVGRYLGEYGFKSEMIHGGLTQGHRNRAMRDFREGIIRILVATDLIARGLDVAHVDTVVNFDFPFEAEDFLHRIGRTARAGRTGKAITFITEDDHKRFQKVKIYTQGAKEIIDHPDFNFAKKVFRDKYKDKASKQTDKASPKNERSDSRGGAKPNFKSSSHSRPPMKANSNEYSKDRPKDRTKDFSKSKFPSTPAFNSNAKVKSNDFKKNESSPQKNSHLNHDQKTKKGFRSRKEREDREDWSERPKKSSASIYKDGKNRGRNRY